MTNRACLVSLAAVLVVSSAASAADNLISGKITVVKPAKIGKFVSKSTTGFPLPQIGGAEDPTLNGAEVRLFDTVASGAGSFTHSLPALGWTGLGNPAGSTGYKYKGKNVGDTVCSVVLIKEKVIKATCKGAGVTLTPPFAGNEGVVLGVPSGTAAAAIRYCTEFGGTQTKNDGTVMKRKDAPAPGSCSVVAPTPTATRTNTVTQTATVTPTATATATRTNTGTATATGTNTATRTATNTGTATATATATRTLTNTASPTVTRTLTSTPTGTPTLTRTVTPTPTNTPGASHACVLTGGGASKIGIYTEALGSPINFNLTGSLSLTATGSVTGCDIVTLSPVNIIGIGFVCISPGASCAAGTRYCGPGGAGSGPALGIDSQSDGNTGTCSNNTACQTICNGTCGGAAQVQTAGCTGFCSGTSPANTACTSDSQCLPSNGACNGPEPISVGTNDKICQCSCINAAAHGASDPGDFQCNLASNIVVETASPCNGTDILINVGNTCIPVSTEQASGLITNANFNASKTCSGGFCDDSLSTPCTSPADCPPSVVPVVGFTNNQTGIPIACATMDSSTVTGWAGVGAVNFFGSTLGDLSVALRAQCN